MVEHLTAQRGEARYLGAETIAPLIERELKALVQGLEGARDRQWESSPVPRPREDTGRKASGGVSDPTSDIVMDTRRLKVSQEIGTAERLIAGIYERLTVQRAALQRAVTRYDGCDL